jgi:hypothetical protein
VEEVEAGRGTTWEREEEAEETNGEVVQEERDKHDVGNVGEKKWVIFSCPSPLLSLLALSLAFFPFLVLWMGMEREEVREGRWIAREEVGGAGV